MAHRNGARDKERSRAQERLEREMRMVIDVGVALARAGVYDVQPGLQGGGVFCNSGGAWD